MAWSSPWTWLAGVKPSAADMNREVRDNLKAMTEWVGWGATYSGGFSATGANVIAAGKIEVGKLCHFQIVLTVGAGAVAAGTALIFSLPNPVSNVGMPIGGATLTPPAGTPRSLGAYVQSTTTLAISTEAGAFVTGTAPLALGVSGTKIQINGTLQLT
jgi:hypothetical protein